MIEHALLCANMSVKSPTTIKHSKECYEWYVNYDEGKVSDEKSVATGEDDYIIIKFFNFKMGEGVYMGGLVNSCEHK